MAEVTQVKDVELEAHIARQRFPPSSARQKNRKYDPAERKPTDRQLTSCGH